jgi:2-polyprenyl-6-methoxyphenol hydroxylase-like FAD-dependent oxidoreductase
LRDYPIVTHDVVIIGGGPAGMMAGLLFARAGISTLVLEKHGDFLRDFRGDTVHPSTMEILDQLGLLERFLQRPHNKVREARGTIAGHEVILGDLRHLNTPAPFIAMMPQWDFLDFLRDEAAAFPAFSLEMNADIAGLVETEGRITGVQLADGRRVHATKLVVAADGRNSIVRQGGWLLAKSLAAPIDVFWFRVPKPNDGGEALRGVVAPGVLIALIDRGDYWQCAYVFRKGMGEKLLAEGIDALRARIEKAAPILGPLGHVLIDAGQMHLLTVMLDRLVQWHRPGLLAIGDAAHAMSPVGGIGINLAIQDAVAAANILSRPLLDGAEVDDILAKVQKRREFPTRVIQRGQQLAQDRIIGAVLAPDAQFVRPPLAVRLLNRFSLLRRIPGRMIGLGVRRERVTSPAA